MSTREKVSENPTTVESNAPVEQGFEDYITGVEFPTYAAPVTPSLNFPLIQYAKGVKVVSGRKPTKHSGFVIQMDQSAEVDALFDGRVADVRVQHLNGKEDSYWALESLKGYFLFYAVPNYYGQDVWKDTGVAYVWNDHKGTYLYGSQFQCLFFSRGLLELGYHHPLVLTLSRTVTDHFVKRVLRRHEAFLNLIQKARQKHNLPSDLGSYAYGCELIVGEEVTTSGGGSYFAPALTMPNPLTVEYAKLHQIPSEHQAIIESHLPILPQWAKVASIRLMAPPREFGDRAASTPDAPPDEEEWTPDLDASAS